MPGTVSRLAHVLAALALVACGGHAAVTSTSDGGSSLDAAHPIITIEGGDYDPGGDAGVFSAPQVQAALAQCNLPHGPAVSVSSADDEQALLTGAWVLCPPGDAGADAGAVVTVFSPGMRLSADGTWTRFLSDGDGGLTLGAGVQNQGQWSAFCEASSSIPNSQPCIFGGQSDVDVSIHSTSQDTSTVGCFGGPISFESTPRRMFVVDDPQLYCDVNSSLGTFDLWMVGL